MKHLISDAAFDCLMKIYERDRILWAAAHVQHNGCGAIGLRKLAMAHGIDPEK